MAKKKDLFKEYEADDFNEREVSRNDFPPNFVFGVATSAYQVVFICHSYFLIYMHTHCEMSRYNVVCNCCLRKLFAHHCSAWYRNGFCVALS